MPTPGCIRIIGGEFRGRRLPVPEKPGLRPTPNRVRETLFNWLQPFLPGSTCLDLFAGSGALALEALSRGAARAVTVERDRALVANLRETASKWGVKDLNCIEKDAIAWLAGEPTPFDIVFLDPPYDAGLLQPALSALTAGGWLKREALLYLEHDLGARPALPDGLDQWRSGHAGQVVFGLYQWAPG